MSHKVDPLKVTTGLEPYLWSFESVSRLGATSGLLKVLAGLEPHLGFGKCQHAWSHIWAFESASRLRATSGFLKVLLGLEPHLGFGKF